MRRVVVIWVLLLQMVTTWRLGVKGDWYETVVENAGISTMHAAVTNTGSVILLDRTNIGDSQLSLPNGVCRDNPEDRANTHDCTAHSALFTPNGNVIRPLFVYTDTWCSSGQFDANGQMVQTGGDADGLMKIRTFAPCNDGNCDWVEQGAQLQNGRWYATNQILPDGSQIVVGGRSVFTIEYVPANGRGTYYLDLLEKTNDAQQDNLYPFVHLLPNNQLFIFANRDSILYDWQSNTVVKNFPTIPGEPRNYPSAGSSVLLPLTSDGGFSWPEVLVCGGAQYGAYMGGNTAADASQTCGRIAPLADDANWAMEYMPQRRTMGDMVLLPTREVLIINGAANGAQGWGGASNPVLAPDLYKPYNAEGTRFSTLTGTDIPRVYHSTANLLQDGRILLAGSNTHQFYTLTGYLPTELRIQAYSPDYLGANPPSFTTVPGGLGYGVDFTAVVKATNPTKIELNLISAPFVTHSYAMGQRLLQLAVTAPADDGAGGYNVYSTSPPSQQVAPAGYYMLFPVADGVVGYAWWVKIG
ncbi:aldehyde oxidase GLOX [Physcomitrium patens]|uniref:Galactose oxidase-like Early set domain-containing protein n=1 Tax=Physcomitrium patens TaxID=3218 RepID=A0A2K1L1M4_PHYPA|nr:aldehyde oxidase GLOX-like [Physcomitrium patens]PNR59923.1 hypothetical protein PHYPA_002715 [Physcomitrium patens]|eukprot:XP_024400855.1 aldehyde oxidase GLOX-like [Physcomitrella patens]